MDQAIIYVGIVVDSDIDVQKIEAHGYYTDNNTWLHLWRDKKITNSDSVKEDVAVFKRWDYIKIEFPHGFFEGIDKDEEETSTSKYKVNMNPPL